MMLRILLLGPPAFVVGHPPLQIKRRLLRALLVYLACQKNPVSRQELMLLFWADKREEELRSNLRDSLAKLRAQLPDPDLLQANGDQVWLDLKRISVDVHEFERAAEQSRHITAQIRSDMPLPLPVVRQMEEAVRLWRTPRFLAGMEMPRNGDFDRWTRSTALRLENERRLMLERLADHAAAAGDLEAALRWVRMALEMDPLNEEFHLRLLKWLSGLGRYTEAQAHCSYLKQLYREEELGEPGELILQACQQIHDQKSFEETKHPHWPVRINTQAPFVGRATVLEQFEIAYRRGWVVCLRGEAGAGKTRLVYEFFRSVRPAPRLMVAPTHPMEKGLPFQPLIDLLRHSIRLEEWQALEPAWVMHLALLLPELSVWRPEVPAPPNPTSKEARAMLFEAMRQVLCLAAKSRRLMLVLEDAQWSDEATLAALAYLLERRFFSQYGLLVINSRVEEGNPALDGFLSHLRQQSNLIDIQLEQLNREDIETLAHFVLGQTPAHELVVRLEHDSGGNPLFLLESLRAILEFSPNLAVEQFDSLPVPGSIHALIRKRLQNLNPAALQVVTTGAVMGGKFNLDLLEAATFLDPEQVAQALEDLEQAHIIRTACEDASDYAFIHDKFREALLLDLSTARRQVLHLRVAKALERRAGRKIHHSAVLAHHFEEAGDLETAFDHWLKAGQHAHNLFSRQEAYDAYRRAEILLEKVGLELPEESIYRLYTGWARIAFQLEDTHTLERIFITQMRIGEQRRSALLLGSAYSGLGYTRYFENSAGEALEAIERGLFYLENTGQLHEQMEAYNRLGSVLTYLRRLDEATQAFQHSLELGSRARDPLALEALANAEAQFAEAKILRGIPQRALLRAESSLCNSERIFYAHGVVQARVQIAWAQYYLCHYAASLEQCQLVLSAAANMQNLRLIGHTHLIAGRSSTALGHLDTAWEHAEQALEQGKRLNNQQILAEGYSIQGDIFRVLENPGAAVDAYRKGGLEDSPTVEALLLRHRMAVALIQAGQHEEGMPVLARAIEVARRMSLAVVYVPAELALGYFYATKGEIERAAELANQVRDAISEQSLATTPPMYKLLTGVIALHSGEAAAAAAAGLQVAASGRDFCNPWFELSGLELAYQAQAQMGAADPGVKDCIRAVLDRVDCQTQNSQIRPAFESFREKVEQLII